MDVMNQESSSGFNSTRSTEIRKGVEGMSLSPGEPDVNLFNLEKVDATLFGDEEATWMNISSGHQIICPDIFGIRHLGTADNLRGKIVRAFITVLDYVWPA